MAQTLRRLAGLTFAAVLAAPLAEWVNHGFARAKEAQEDLLTARDTFAQIGAKAATAATECHRHMIEIASAKCRRDVRPGARRTA
jgi:hypothetical protein